MRLLAERHFEKRRARDVDEAAVEEVFVNANPQSTLKLGQARGVCLLAAARAGLPVAEYATRLVKKAIEPAGHSTRSPGSPPS